MHFQPHLVALLLIGAAAGGVADDVYVATVGNNCIGTCHTDHSDQTLGVLNKARGWTCDSGKTGQDFVSRVITCTNPNASLQQVKNLWDDENFICISRSDNPHTGYGTWP